MVWLSYGYRLSVIFLVDTYKKTRSLDEYVVHVRNTTANLSEGLVAHYERMIYSYNNGNPSPLLENLYDRLLAADEYKTKVADELKSLLRELWEYSFKMSALFQNVI